MLRPHVSGSAYETAAEEDRAPSLSGPNDGGEWQTH